MNLNPLEQIDAAVVLGTVVIFVLTYVALRAAFLSPVIAVMQERRARLADAERKCTEAAAIVDDARAQAERIAHDAHEQADVLRKDAVAAMERERREQLAAVRADIAKHLEQGRSEIREAKLHEAQAVAEEAKDCVRLATERILGGGDADVDAIVTRLAEERLLQGV